MDMTESAVEDTRVPTAGPLPAGEGVVHTFRGDILSSFSAKMRTNARSSDSVCISRAGIESIQGDTTTILDLVKGIVSTLSTVTYRLQASEAQIARVLPPPPARNRQSCR
ncbi:hypothetical protein EG68_00176 [Paragonimus skrjabini miyazakii]|uniref:Uncharacterized protein n=1 Tax=Paragonimus skrjabini miyazakii TaxID=59628 RepID=A0A8S9Z9K3_9TREM|nr:hypothetical protein EG68_00176 [Paragonimus skrjabini miyazakii]